MGYTVIGDSCTDMPEAFERKDEVKRVEEGRREEIEGECIESKRISDERQKRRVRRGSKTKDGEEVQRIIWLMLIKTKL